jgi:DedD protein
LATQFQNRLIGTVILVSLGVIFLPDLLMGKKNDIAAPAGSIPLRPEQSLASVPQHEPAVVAGEEKPANQVNNNAVSAVNATQPHASSDVIVASNSSAQANTVTTTAVKNNESWKVEEVAGPVTVAEPATAKEDAIKVAAMEKQQAAALAKAKNHELELKRKESLLAAKEAAKAKELARVQEVIEPIATANVKTESASVIQQPEAAITEKPATTTIKRDENGLTIKTAAQVEAERAAKSAGVTTASPANSATKPTPSVVHSGSWIIQVGVFSNAVNAQALATKLRNSGYGASAQRAGQMTRVVVGPDVSKDKLQSMLGKINQASGTSARVIPYSVVGN